MKKLALLFSLIIVALQMLGQSNESYAVMFSVEIQESPPAFHLSWDQDTTANEYLIYRNKLGQNQWGAPFMILDSTQTTYSDYDVEAGQIYEYSVFKTPCNYYDTFNVATNNEYRFTIYDSWGDGICCWLGNGHYKIYTSDSLYAMGGDFGSSYSEYFTVVEQGSNTNLVVELYVDAYPEETTWELRNMTTNNIVASGGPYDFPRYGYISACINCQAEEHKGKLLVIMDEEIGNTLEEETELFINDLIGSGWQVVRRNINTNISVPEVKSIILEEYNNDTSLNALILLGDIPVPYSGIVMLDGHPDHKGAWPADVYYAVLDGEWTDEIVDINSASRPENHNVPGDGKFDQSYIPANVILQTGRIYFSKLDVFNLSEAELYRRYFNKNHRYRHGQYLVARKSLVSITLNIPKMATAYRNFNALFGKENIIKGNYFNDTLPNDYYGFGYGAGPGSYSSCMGVGTSASFVENNAKYIYSMYFGSYFGDWDSDNNLLRSAIANENGILATAWGCNPQWKIHPMGIGKDFGFCTRLTQNAYKEYVAGYGDRTIHVALMGDPTLKMYVVKPIGDISIDSSKANEYQLNWSSSGDTVQGYYIYRSSSYDDKFIRISEQIVADTFFTDNEPLGGKNLYMVRAVKKELTPSGSFQNLSQGVFIEVENGTTSVPSGSFFENLQIFPNPFADIIHIELHNINEEMIDVEVYNTQGVKVAKENFSNPGAKFDLNLSGLSKGVYLLYIRYNNEYCTEKIIKQ